MGSSLFARHYLGNHICSLFLQVLRCFSSLGSRFHNSSSNCQVAPFGHLRINPRLQVPAAFRSLPRPSSPLRAQASPVRPYLLPALHICCIIHRYFDLLPSVFLRTLLFFLPNLSMNFFSPVNTVHLFLSSWSEYITSLQYRLQVRPCSIKHKFTRW